MLRSRAFYIEMYWKKVVLKKIVQCQKAQYIYYSTYPKLNPKPDPNPKPNPNTNPNSNPKCKTCRQTRHWHCQILSLIFRLYVGWMAVGCLACVTRWPGSGSTWWTRCTTSTSWMSCLCPTSSRVLRPPRSPSTTRHGLQRHP